MYTLNFIHAGTQQVTLTLRKVKAGQSLLEVAIEHDIGLPHECGGICSCATCHIFLEKGNEYVEFKAKREIHQLQRNERASAHSRLACQCVLLPGKGELTIIIPEPVKR